MRKSRIGNFIVRTFLMLAAFAWIFSGWPPIVFRVQQLSFSFPPPVQMALAGSCSATSVGTTTCDVPSGVTSVTVTLWGGGGAGGAAGDGTSQDGGGGGGGGYVTGTLSVTAPITLSMYVGGGGTQGSATAGSTDCGAGGGGGGASMIWNGTSYVAIVGGGAGGGGGMDDTSETGGGGGGGGGGNGGNGLTGQNLNSAWGDFGDGATTAAVGAGGNLNAGTNGAAGSGFRGGTGAAGGGGAGGTNTGGAGASCASNVGGGGGGGGGAFGGGGGENGVDEGGGGGGGGSGKTSDLTSVTTGQGGQGANNGTAGAAAGDSDSNYSGTVGDGGAGGQTSNGNGSAGNAGKVVITWTDPTTAPTVTTSVASSITSTSATLNGNITATGGENSTVRGFAWGTNSSLTGGDTATTTENGSFGTGAFTNSSLTLTCNTTYYSRAYATNSIGTGFGSVSSSFTTSACDAAPTLSVTDPDGTNDTVSAGDTYTIAYSLADSDSTVTASFSYDSDGSGLDGTYITGACVGVSEGTGNCAWDTTGVTPGTYYIYATTTDGTTGVSDYSPGQVTVEAAAPVYSVSITSDGTIAYGFVELGTASSTVDHGETQTVQNDGNAAEKINVKSSNATGGTQWALASTVGTDQFKHEFSTTTGSTWTAMTASDTYVLARPSLAAAGTMSFDFRLTTPSATTDFQQKSVTITIQAEAP